MTKRCVIAAKAKLDMTTVMAGLLALTALALVPGMALGAAAASKDSSVKSETVAGTNLKRVILAAKAVDRLGIKTSAVREQVVARTQMVGGEVVAPPSTTPMVGKEMTASAFGGSLFSMPVAAPVVTTGPIDTSGTWVRVALSETEIERVVLDQPVQVTPLAARKGEGMAVTARPSKLPPMADQRNAAVALHYVVDGTGHNLGKGQRVRVGMTLVKSAGQRKVVPYSAVFYDSHGQSWVYANPEPSVYVRHKVGVEYVEGDLAVLSDGPAKGTQVVSVGAMLLYGAEKQQR